MKGVCGFFFFPKDPSISKDPSIEGTIQLGWEKEARADPVDCCWVGWGGGSSDGSLTRHTVSTQALGPQLLELEGASQLSHPNCGYRRGNRGHCPGNLLSEAWPEPCPTLVAWVSCSKGDFEQTTPRPASARGEEASFLSREPWAT